MTRTMRKRGGEEAEAQGARGDSTQWGLSRGDSMQWGSSRGGQHAVGIEQGGRSGLKPSHVSYVCATQQTSKGKHQ